MQSHPMLRAALAAAALILLVQSSAGPTLAAEEQTVEIVTRGGVHTFTVEFAEKLPRALNRHYAGSRFQFRTFLKTNGYVNVPLDGIWARAPYLHNGSVPSLRDLLEPEKCRPPRFYRGSDVFDAENVGFVSYPDLPGADQNCPTRADRQAPGPPPVRGPDEPELFLFDTGIAGNHNTGHPWGTALPANLKRALVEFLKTL